MHNTVWVNHKFLTHHYQATLSQKTTPVWHRCPISNTSTFLNVSFFYWESSFIVFAIAGLQWTVRKTKKKKSCSCSAAEPQEQAVWKEKGQKWKERKKKKKYIRVQTVITCGGICISNLLKHWMSPLFCVWMFHLILVKSLFWWRRNLVKGDST